MPSLLDLFVIGLGGECWLVDTFFPAADFRRYGIIGAEDVENNFIVALELFLVYLLMGQEFAPQFLVGLDFQVHTVSIADQIGPFGFVFYLLNIRHRPFYQQLALERVLEVAEKLVLIIGVLLGESAGKYFHTGIEKFQW